MGPSFSNSGLHDAFHDATIDICNKRHERIDMQNNKSTASDLARFIKQNGGHRGNFQFRLIANIKGVEFGSPVYTYETLLLVLNAHEIEHGDIVRIVARPAGRLEWTTF
jgi:hypothetical protein